MRIIPLFDYVIFFLVTSKCSYNVACAKGVKRGWEEGFRARTQAITMNEIFRRPQSDIKARVTVSVWTGIQVGFVSFIHIVLVCNQLLAQAGPICK